ncbi:SPFH domain-containing protein [Durusdinium trenchii]|uniref:SPFH domain-containing protein n=1 Tax=Durusdinium trenchii TaxID=1381693 RepID=A0ABP0P954_9DINO
MPEALPLEPGIHVYWPIVTEIDVIVVARQTLKVTGQVLTTLDGKEVVVGTVVVYRIHDVVKAIGKKNWDVDSTLSDITEAATMDVVASTTFEDILAGIGNGMIADRLTKACRSELRRYGVYVSRARMSDFARCKVHKLVNTLAQNPDSGCEAVGTLPLVTAPHVWSVSDVEAIRAKLTDICADNSFEAPLTIWSQAIIDEIEAAIANGWCNCEDACGVCAVGLVPDHQDVELLEDVLPDLENPLEFPAEGIFRFGVSISTEDDDPENQIPIEEVLVRSVGPISGDGTYIPIVGLSAAYFYLTLGSCLQGSLSNTTVPAGVITPGTVVSEISLQLSQSNCQYLFGMFVPDGLTFEQTIAAFQGLGAPITCEFDFDDGNTELSANFDLDPETGEVFLSAGSPVEFEPEHVEQLVVTAEIVANGLTLPAQFYLNLTFV